ncbi:MAG: HAMP domain-containing sensor histidine kinase [Bacteroidales bacterium]|jgi:two-component system phosphate regulon sensor histidine kinase PhoR|nr:HAMP domain-containing sensor histidine kinase [Bacteroidales bacterium]
MKKRSAIFFLGIIAIMILIAVQMFILKGVWNQKNEMFDLRYRLLSQEAISWLSRRWSVTGFDTANYIISRYSEKIVKDEFDLVRTDTSSEGKKTIILRYVKQVLEKEQDLSEFLSSYFERQGFEKDFNHIIVINQFDLINFDERIPVYENRDLRPGRTTAESVTGMGASLNPTSRILVNRYYFEDNSYRLMFDYFIDFSDKQKMILKETAGSLLLSIMSIIAVAVLFMITYRNLMEEKRLSNLKTDFINNMTHELKTPLSTITVAGRTLEMDQIRTDEKKILETAKLIGKQSVHLNQLINMILEISMWERTQFELDRKKVKIDELMNDITGSFTAGCGNCAELHQKYNFNGAVVDLDIVYFTTLINNLLSNAVKYSEKDPVISIEGFTENDNIHVRVTDNGIGISKNDQKHIFDKFYRASSGNIHKYKGLGLGLYYVKRIADAHGGNVTVSSKPGKGSTFTVTIPVNNDKL